MLTYSLLMPLIPKSSTQIYVVYHTEAPLFESELLRPIQTGCDLAIEDLGMLRDACGEHQSAKNPHWCELTVLYWLWKNALEAEPQCEYWGLCHYRRFMSLTRKPAGQQRKIGLSEFKACFEKDFAHAPQMGDFDLYLPEAYDAFPLTAEQDYLKHHDRPSWELMKEVLCKLHPEYKTSLDSFCAGYELHFALNFVIRRCYFEQLMAWMFSLVEQWEQEMEQRGLEFEPRGTGFIMERLINVWYLYQQAHAGMRIKEVYSCLRGQDMSWWRRASMNLWHNLPLPKGLRRLLRSCLRRFKLDVTQA